VNFFVSQTFYLETQSAFRECQATLGWIELRSEKPWVMNALQRNETGLRYNNTVRSDDSLDGLPCLFIWLAHLPAFLWLLFFTLMNPFA
jgi:hypothetical protein